MGSVVPALCSVKYRANVSSTVKSERRGRILSNREVRKVSRGKLRLTGQRQPRWSMHLPMSKLKQGIGGRCQTDRE